MPPPGEARADWWIVARVAQALGFGSAFAWQHPHEVFSEHAALSGYENDGQRRLTSADWRISAAKRGMRWNRCAGR